LLEEQITADQDDDTDFFDASRREKQIEKLQKQAERIEKWLEENDASNHIPLILQTMCAIIPPNHDFLLQPFTKGKPTHG